MPRIKWFDPQMSTPLTQIKTSQKISAGYAHKFLPINSTRTKVSYIARVPWFALEWQIVKWDLKEHTDEAEMNKRKGKQFRCPRRDSPRDSPPEGPTSCDAPGNKNIFSSRRIPCCCLTRAMLSYANPTGARREWSFLKSFPGLFASRFFVN